MSTATVLIVGSGGREHALGLALGRSPEVGRLLFAGGPNAGLEEIAERIEAGAAEAAAATADLVVIGPEAPLAAGLSDRLRASGCAVFGPDRAAAEIEVSKAFAKEICAEAGVPTARAKIATSAAEGYAAVREFGAPVVVKADGLAAGKGVVVAATLGEAERAVGAAFDGAFGEAGARLVVEERLEGPEVSLFALADGNAARLFATARDYKRAHDGDRGPNTGGMGAVSPAPGFADADAAAAMDSVVRPTLAALARRGAPYLGVLYAGLMLTTDGPKVIEFNARFGDPECQAILPRLRSDPFRLLHATAAGRLADAEIALADTAAVAVVVAANGYPGEYAKGELIGGLAAVEAAGATMLHAGTRRDAGRVVSNGGRVLSAVAEGPDAASARTEVYRALESLDWPGGYYRRDIAR